MKYVFLKWWSGIEFWQDNSARPQFWNSQLLNSELGPESRGGYSYVCYLFSNEQIYFPEAVSFDCLLALNQESFDKNLFDLRENGILMWLHLVKISLSVENTMKFPHRELILINWAFLFLQNIARLFWLKLRIL
jgi:hypothetical protein